MGSPPLYAIGYSKDSSDDYVVAPVYAFNAVVTGQVNETYPYLKQHEVIATGTKMECLQGLKLIRRERVRLRGELGSSGVSTPQRLGQRASLPMERALAILATVAEGPAGAAPRDFSRCHRCYGEGVVYLPASMLPAGQTTVRCSLCGGSGRGAR